MRDLGSRSREFESRRSDQIIAERCECIEQQVQQHGVKFRDWILRSIDDCFYRAEADACDRMVMGVGFGTDVDLPFDLDDSSCGRRGHCAESRLGNMSEDS